MVDASLRASILGTLRDLHDSYGISFLYITHDLTTAYQVSDDILVLYKGNVVESGDVVPVIKDPQHPYTRLLVSSIPWPDPSMRWGDETPPDPSTFSMPPILNRREPPSEAVPPS
jgi:peptide/nickel transport system ATP-binding protein